MFSFLSRYVFKKLSFLKITKNNKYFFFDKKKIKTSKYICCENRRKPGKTLSHYGPYGLGYACTTRVVSIRCENVLELSY